MADKKTLIPLSRVENLIMVIRNQKVMLDKDLASLYGVTTGNLNLAVTRNIKRFPEDFMFRLTRQEFDGMISQNVIWSLRAWHGISRLSGPFVN